MKSIIVNAAACGCWAIAGSCTALDDPAALHGEISEDTRAGFAGKLCTHPGQRCRVEPVGLGKRWGLVSGGVRFFSWSCGGVVLECLDDGVDAGLLAKLVL